MPSPITRGSGSLGRSPTDRGTLRAPAQTWRAGIHGLGNRHRYPAIIALNYQLSLELLLDTVPSLASVYTIKWIFLSVFLFMKFSAAVWSVRGSWVLLRDQNLGRELA